MYRVLFCRFFTMFGTLFTFVSKDVTAKIGLLHSYAEDEAMGPNYQTIQVGESIMDLPKLL